MASSAGRDAYSTMDIRPRAPFTPSRGHNTAAPRERTASTGKENANEEEHQRDQPRPSSMFAAPPRTARGRGGKDSDEETARTPIRRDGKAMSMGASANAGLISQQFSRLLDDLQVDSALRLKLEPLDTPVKSQLLRASANPAFARASLASFGGVNTVSAGSHGRLVTPQLRKAKSSSSLSPSPGGTPLREAVPAFAVQTAGHSRFVMITPSRTDITARHRPGQSLDIPRGELDLTNKVKTPGKMTLSVFGGRKRGMSKAPTAGKSSWSQTNGSSTSEEAEGEIIPASFLSMSDTPSKGKKGKGKTKAARPVEHKDPAEFAAYLARTKMEAIDLARIKTLRMLLRHESTSWVRTFVGNDGYTSLLSRLHDVLVQEWRDEQHDDQLLFELVRCVKAMATSDCGKAAVRAHGAVPFRALTELLLSEKKPGDIATRQIIVELVHALLATYTGGLVSPVTDSPATFAPQMRPWDTQSAASGSSRGSAQSRPSSVTFSDGMVRAPTVVTIPNGHSSIAGYILSLLQPTPTRDSAEIRRDGAGEILVPAHELGAPAINAHDFLSVAKQPRVYKTYLQEMSSVCIDYFWIMCHGENGIWTMNDLNADSAARPAAPCGASGGVEFEAMEYLTTHFKLLNAISLALFEEDMLDPLIRQDLKTGQGWQFHADLMMSGMDRLLVTVRKASVDFYPHFHLEIARFIRHAQDANLKLPYPVQRLLGPPCEKYRRRHAATPAGREAATATNAPWLPLSGSIGNFEFQT